MDVPGFEIIRRVMPQGSYRQRDEHSVEMQTTGQVVCSMELYKDFYQSIRYAVKSKEFQKICLKWPPAIFLVLILTIEICQFTGPIASWLVYDPKKRLQLWRFLTYMMIHTGHPHLWQNICILSVAGIPLVAVNKLWSVVFIILAGAVAGCLTNSIFVPDASLCGASAVGYALVTAHIATMILNWHDTKYRALRIILIISVLKEGNLIVMNDKHDLITGHWSHRGGAVAGLLIGIVVLQIVQEKPWKKNLRLNAIRVFFILMLIAVGIHLFWSDHFSASTEKGSNVTAVVE